MSASALDALQASTQERERERERESEGGREGGREGEREGLKSRELGPWCPPGLEPHAAAIFQTRCPLAPIFKCGRFQAMGGALHYAPADGYMENAVKPSTLF